MDKNGLDKQVTTNTTASDIGLFNTRSLPAASGPSALDPGVGVSIGLQEYLDKYIDGYLLHDLDSIDKRIPSDLHPGAAAYPMILTVCAGIEFLGALLRPGLGDEFNGHKGGVYFKYYWENYLTKMNPDYKQYSNIARSLIRNGIAHTFITKPNIGVVRYNPSLHLKRTDGTLIIDATLLYDDFRKSYEEYAKPLILDEKQGTMLASKRLKGIMELYSVDTDTALLELTKASKESEKI